MWSSKRSERASQDSATVDRLFDDLEEAPAEQGTTKPASTTEVKASAGEPKGAAPATKATVAEQKSAAPAASVLGRTLHFRGDLSADEDLVLQGRVEGSITHSRSLTVGPDGSTKGDIVARDITVEGRVEGDLHAEGSVTVRATGDVRGSIIAPRVALADGASFNGQIDMQSKPAAASAGRSNRAGEQGAERDSSVKKSATGV